MRLSFEKGQIEKLLKERNGYMMLALGSLLICLIQLILVFVLIGREKIVIVPASIEKSFWVSSHSVSPEYLAEMALFFANLRLNITPESAQFQRDTLLRYTDPNYYGSFKSKLVEEGDRVSEQHLSIAFFPVGFPKVDEKNLKVIVDGDVKAYVGESAIPTKRMSYLITFTFNSSRLLVKSFEEVKHA